MRRLRNPPLPLRNPRRPENPAQRERLATILSNVGIAKSEGGITAVQRGQLENAIRGQVERCWSPDAGALRSENLVVELTVNLAPDGRVAGQSKVIDARRMSRDAYFRTAAEKAIRAVLRCSPFDLPINQYVDWKQMTLSFNPREMFGR